VQVGEGAAVLQRVASGVDRLPRQCAGMMKPADAKASDMSATQTHAAQMRHAAETHAAATQMRYAAAAEAHPAASTAQMRYAAAAEAHPAASTAQMHSAAAAVETTSATADVSATTAAAATEAGRRGQWRHNGRQRRQQDCANHNSVIFHEYLPEQSRAPRLDAAATTEAACPSRGLSCSSLRYQNRGELCGNDGRLPMRRCD
jgi:hypothetical protein